VDQDLLTIEASRSHSDTPHSVGLLSTSDQPDAETSTWQPTTLTPCLRWESNPQSHQPRDRRLGSALHTWLAYKNNQLSIWCVGNDSSVGIATIYGLGGSGIESRWGDVIFCTRPKRPWGLPSLLYNWCRVCFPWVKQPERGVDHQPPSIVEERVEPCLYSHSGPSYPIMGRPLPLIRHDVNYLQNSQGWELCGSYLANTEDLQHGGCCMYHLLLWHSETLRFARRMYRVFQKQLYNFESL
jgi:hypothetical protein